MKANFMPFSSIPMDNNRFHLSRVFLGLVSPGAAALDVQPSVIIKLLTTFIEHWQPWLLNVFAKYRIDCTYMGVSCSKNEIFKIRSFEMRYAGRGYLWWLPVYVIGNGPFVRFRCCNPAGWMYFLPVYTALAKLTQLQTKLLLRGGAPLENLSQIFLKKMLKRL